MVLQPRRMRSPAIKLQRVPAAAVQKQAWNCSHNVLRAHAAAVKEFRAAVPAGRISMSLNSEWAQPLTNSTADAVSSRVPSLTEKRHNL